MKKIVEKQIKKLNKKEDKIINKKESKIFKKKVEPILEKIDNKIPDKLKDTLEVAFFKGFNLVLEKGTKYIEKSYNKDKIQLEHDVNNYAIEKKITKKSIKMMDFQAKKSKFFNSTISTVEGAGLGILGVGLPDIPLFIAVILKTIYEIALSYGFDYKEEGEKIYILNLICVALTDGENKKYYKEKLDELENKIDSNIVLDNDLNEEIKQTSHVLSQAMLTAKFIQGLPIVGILGSVTNYMVINKISKYATIKYKKRYLGKVEK